MVTKLLVIYFPKVGKPLKVSNLRRVFYSPIIGNHDIINF